MSSLNKAFIQVYKKNNRSAPNTAVAKPHFASDDRVAKVDAVEAAPEQTTRKVETKEEIAFFRVDHPADASMVLQPWLTSISTFGIDEYVAQSQVRSSPNRSNASIQNRTAPEISPATLPTEQTAQVVEEIEEVEETTLTLPRAVEETTPVVPSHRVDRRRSSVTVSQTAVTEQPVAATERNQVATERIAVASERNPVIAEAYPDVSEHAAPAVEESSPKPSTDRRAVQQQAVLSIAESPAPKQQFFQVVEEPSTEASLMVEDVASDRPFHAVWEVDSFQWPTLIDDLFRREAHIMHDVARHLGNACQSGLKILAVTSAKAGQGRTTVSLCLARSAAKLGLKVALVETDLHQADLADQLNLELAHGWEETLSSGLPIEEAAVHSIDDRVTLIPFSARENPMQIAPDHPKVHELLRNLSSSFDLVILDSQHLGHPAGRLVGGGIDTPIHAAVLVLGRTLPGEDAVTEDAMRRLYRQGIESVGIVENFQ